MANMHEATKIVRQEDLIRLLVIGFNLKECANQLGWAYRTVRVYAAEPEFLARLRELSAEAYAKVESELQSQHADIFVKLAQASDRALDKLVELLDSPKEEVALRAAQDLLDRDGRITRKSETKSEHTHKVFDPAALLAAATAAKEMERFYGGRIEVPVISGSLPDLPQPPDAQNPADSATQGG
jgi:hypothetical protein